jgi:hypothetical protein
LGGKLMLWITSKLISAPDGRSSAFGDSTDRSTANQCDGIEGLVTIQFSEKQA